MEVLLKKDIDRLGNKDEIVTVKNGFGRNYLIPKGIAVLATESVKKMHAETLKQRAHKDNQLKDEAFKIYEKMKMQDVDVRIDYSDIEFSKGDLILPMKQKKSNLIAELMEPEAPNSYDSFGLIKTGINKILPIYRIREL